jgi:hypothetical protein
MPVSLNQLWSGIAAAISVANTEITAPLTNAVPRTVVSRLGDHPSVKEFGAKGDGVTNDTAAIQAAIDSLKVAPGSFPHNGTRKLFFPSGYYLISTSILTYGGITLYGEGDASRLYAPSGIASGRGMIELKGEVNPTYCSGAVIENLGFESTLPGVWAIKQATSPIQNCRFENLFFNTLYGLALDSYAQGCKIDNVFSYGNIERLLYLKGNFNHIGLLDKEGGSGTTTEPYVEIAAHITNPSTANRIDQLLIESVGHANKTALKLDGVWDLEIGTVWIEFVPNINKAIVMNNAQARIRNFSAGFHFGVTLGGASKLSVDTLEAHSFDIGIADLPIVFSDTNSIMEVDLLSSRRADLNTRHPQLNVRRHRVLGLVTTPITDVMAEFDDQIPQGENVFGAGSFESALGWWVQPTGTFSAVTYPNSELMFDNGAKMLKGVVAGTPGTKFFSQTFVVPSGMIGRAVEFEIWSKIIGTENAVLSTTFGGLNFGSSLNYCRNWGGKGWVKHRMRGRIGTSGTMNVYLYMTGFVNNEELYLDQSRLVVV